MPRRHVDLDVADGQLVCAQAAVHVDRAPAAVLDVQRFHLDPIARQLERGAGALVARPGGLYGEPGILDID